ncbi:tRNA 5-carboxymethoxyuridine methyltransferase [subsurface metagenome]
MKRIEKIEREIEEYQQKLYGGVISPKWSIKLQIEGNFNEKEGLIQLEEINEALKMAYPQSQTTNMKVLDIGCGFGFFVLACLNNGLDCYGCEIEPNLVDIGRNLLSLNDHDTDHIRLIEDGKMPFQNSSFDLINLHYVLGYVANLSSLFDEILRVLKKGGYMYMITPNYLCFYEANYGLFLIPWLPRSVNKVYLKIKGRTNVDFLDTLNFVTLISLGKFFRQYHLSVKNIGLERWNRDIENMNFAHRSHPFQFLVKSAHKYHLLFLPKFMGKMGFYTPLVYLVKKGEPE